MSAQKIIVSQVSTNEEPLQKEKKIPQQNDPRMLVAPKILRGRRFLLWISVLYVILELVRYTLGPADLVYVSLPNSKIYTRIIKSTVVSNLNQEFFPWRQTLRSPWPTG
jgi:cell division septal protein FtsQ